MAKKNAGTINFYRFMALIGVFVIGGLGYSFLGAAPKITPTPHHAGPPAPEDCMRCHVLELESAPIMPHRPMTTCTICHEPVE